MSKTQTPKHEFPKDWSKLSEEEIVSHLKYLLDHIQEYEIQQVAKNKIIIGNIIRIFDVNNGVFHGLEDKYITYLSRNSYAFYVLNSLYDKCEQQINTKDKKMNNKKTVSSVRMYIRRDKLGDIYCVDYKYENDDETYKREFKHNMDSANYFLKELYENLSANFTHYNHTMFKYNGKLTTAYFFNASNNDASYGYVSCFTTYVGEEGMKALKNAYKNIFGKRLKPSRAIIKQEAKTILVALAVSVAVTSPFGLVVYNLNKQQKDLDNVKNKTEQYEKQLEQKILQYEATIDSLKNAQKE